MQKITPCLWFEGNGQEAADFYLSVFPNAKKGRVSYYGEGAPLPAGTLLTVELELEGQQFLILNGGPYVKFNDAVSFTVYCETQEEVDYYWDKLTADGGLEVQCGWLKDKFGVSWQITPTIMAQYVTDSDPEKVSRVMQTMMKMIKLDIATLQRAYNGE
jgi:predicted 3-demethylubiquinone-9 3-methyltransferase (glyoxalase superfamily)